MNKKTGSKYFSTPTEICFMVDYKFILKDFSWKKKRLNTDEGKIRVVEKFLDYIFFSALCYLFEISRKFTLLLVAHNLLKHT